MLTIHHTLWLILFSQYFDQIPNQICRDKINTKQMRKSDIVMKISILLLLIHKLFGYLQSRHDS